MGFFSRLKKAWGGSKDIEKPTRDEHTQPQAAQEETVAKPAPAAESDAAPTADKGWQQNLTLSLRQAEPKLSEWLNLIVEGVPEKGPALWERLAFLFKALGAPEQEGRDFIAKFEAWLNDMGYVNVAEFKSELQYRLALALELEDEEDERDRLFLKLSEGISKTREQITKRIDSLLSSHSSLNDDFWEEFEEILIMADVGMEAANQLMGNLKARAHKAGTDNPDDFKDILRDELEEIFKVPPRIEVVNPPEVLMMVGVNGVGKTTTIAKLAYRAQMQGRKVLIAAGDTFRAAAIDQLKVWAEPARRGILCQNRGQRPCRRGL